MPRKKCQLTIEYVVKLSFKIRGEKITSRLKENKIAELTSNRFLLQMILNNEFQAEVIPSGKSQKQKDFCKYICR